MRKFLFLLLVVLSSIYFTGCDNNDTQLGVNYPLVDESAKTMNVPLLKESDLN